MNMESIIHASTRKNQQNQQNPENMFMPQILVILVQFWSVLINFVQFWNHLGRQNLLDIYQNANEIKLKQTARHNNMQSYLRC